LILVLVKTKDLVGSQYQKTVSEISQTRSPMRYDISKKMRLQPLAASRGDQTLPENSREKNGGNTIFDEVTPVAQRKCDPQTNWMRPAPMQMIE